MTWWHLHKNHTTEEVSEGVAKTLANKGEIVTNNPFQAATWED